MQSSDVHKLETNRYVMADGQNYLSVARRLTAGFVPSSDTSRNSFWIEERRRAATAQTKFFLPPFWLLLWCRGIIHGIRQVFCIIMRLKSLWEFPRWPPLEQKAIFGGKWACNRDSPNSKSNRHFPGRRQYSTRRRCWRCQKGGLRDYFIYVSIYSWLQILNLTISKVPLKSSTQDGWVFPYILRRILMPFVSGFEKLCFFSRNLIIFHPSCMYLEDELDFDQFRHSYLLLQISEGFFLLA